jgi:predicted anti-sigma-YlaC factor YlaD
MKCNDVVVNLPDHVLGKVEPNLKKSIESHLELCSKCRAELATMQKAAMVLGGIEREEYPDRFWQELKACIMDRIAEPRTTRWKVPAFGGGLVVLLLAIGIGIYEYSTKPAQQASNITALATSLPSVQVVDLSNLNINYVDSAVQPIHESDEMSSVDDSTQFAVVKAMWTSVVDSSISLDDLDYTGNVSSN